MSSDGEPQKTLAIWWRYGKEHSEDDGFRVNPPAVVEQHLDAKAAHFRATAPATWRWWGEGNLIVERPDPDGYGYGADTRIYYLVDRGLTIVENIHLPAPWTPWSWYIHLADIFYDARRQCWISKDLFCDVILTPDGRRYHVNDLGDVGHALYLGLLSAEQATHILRRTDALLEAIVLGHFPFPEIAEAQALCRRLGW
uniref:DUF402 domain-containing protein n=1 Tax=uncultured bacterium A1Q1_fos_1246 TaxID=1256545 RepID=L7VZB5_9BACT|nr:hypothetical protein [uncultured bacterium A1Q1_fos_1246]